MRFIVAGLEAGTNKPLKGVIEAKDAASAKAAVAKRGWTEIRVKEAPPAAPGAASAAAASATPRTEPAPPTPTPPDASIESAPQAPKKSKLLLIVLIAVLALGGGIFWWWLTPNVKENREVSMTHIRSIINVSLLWMHDRHPARFPDHLVQLVVDNQCQTDWFVNPNKGTKPVSFSAADLEKGKQDWHALASQLDEHCDYYYYGANMPDNTDMTMIILCEKPYGQTDGYIVGFGDCHAEFVLTKDLPAVFEKHNALLRSWGGGRKELILVDGKPPAP